MGKLQRRLWVSDITLDLIDKAIWKKGELASDRLAQWEYKSGIRISLIFDV